MNHISEIRKQNAQTKADLDNSQQGRFTTLSNGGILLSCGGRCKTLEPDRDKADVAAFLEKVRDKSSGVIREVVKSYFTPVSA